MEDQPWLVVFIGITIVFIALLLLIFVFTIFGKIMHGANKRGKQKKPVKQQTVEASSPAPANPVSDPVPVVQQGIPGEVVAAISAAVTAYTGGASAVIRSIRKKQSVSGRSAWAQAGISENTRPF